MMSRTRINITAVLVLSVAAGCVCSGVQRNSGARKSVGIPQEVWSDLFYSPESENILRLVEPDEGSLRVPTRKWILLKWDEKVAAMRVYDTGQIREGAAKGSLLRHTLLVEWRIASQLDELATQSSWENARTSTVPERNHGREGWTFTVKIGEEIPFDIWVAAATADEANPTVRSVHIDPVKIRSEDGLMVGILAVPRLEILSQIDLKFVSWPVSETPPDSNPT